MTRPIVIGLTGSIGMGKSTTSRMFADAGLEVWSADDAVHRLYAKGGAGVPLIKGLFPEAVSEGKVDRAVLAGIVTETPGALARIEEEIHPLVAKDRAAFLASAAGDLVVLDVPLLFETGLHDQVDHIVVVTTTADEQRRRVFERPGMTEEKLKMILAEQMPDSEKRARAEFVIETSSLEHAAREVHSVIEQIRAGA